MGVEKKWIARLFSTLFGKLYSGAGGQHKSTGEGGVHIGKMDGGFTQVHLTQHIYPPKANVSPVRVSRPELRAGPRLSAKEDQHQVLKLLDQVPDRMAVLDFMMREFGTRLVIDLEAQQLFRLRRYVQAILKRQGEK